MKVGNGRGRCDWSRVEDEVFVIDGKLGSQRCERQVVEVRRGAVLASSAVGVLVISDVHDWDN